jgi:hypothetical protein
MISVQALRTATAIISRLTLAIAELIHQSGGQSTVERMALDANRHGSLPLSLKGHDTAILVVSGTMPFTAEEASFELEIK